MWNILSNMGKGFVSNLFKFAKKEKKWGIRTEYDKDGIQHNTMITDRDQCTPCEKTIWDRDYGSPKKGK